MADDDELEDDIPHGEILDIEQLKRLREDNPAGLYRHLDSLAQRFMFGIEPTVGWGGPFRILINRNLALHLVRGYDEDMPDRDHLPQFCAVPSDEVPDTAESTSIFVEGEEIRGIVFWVDHYDFDDLLRDAGRIAEEYPAWDLIPDSYYLDTDLVRWIARVVLEEPRIITEREFDFRLGFPGVLPPPLKDDEMYTAADLISSRDDADEDADADEDVERDDDDDDDEPLKGMRTVPAEFG